MHLRSNKVDKHRGDRRVQEGADDVGNDSFMPARKRPVGVRVADLADRPLWVPGGHIDSPIPEHDDENSKKG